MKERTKEVYQYALGAIVALGEISFVVFLLYIWHVGASTTDQGVVNLIYGMALGYHSGFMLILGYFFGSSKGSADKTKAMVESGQAQQNK